MRCGRPNLSMPGGKMVLLIVAVLMGGGLLIVFQTRQTEAWMREDFLDRARRVAQGVHAESTGTLAGDAQDLDSPFYRRLKTYLTLVRQDQPDLRLVYVMRLNPDGEIVILADSEPPESPDYSPPGDVLNEADPALYTTFESDRGSVCGPVSDRWGIWMTAGVPVIGNDGQPAALLGMDISAADWARRIRRGAWPAAMLTAALVGLVLFGARLLRRVDRGDDLPPSRMVDHAETVLVVAVGVLLTAYGVFLAHQRERRDQTRALRQLADMELGRLTYRLKTIREYRLPALAAMFESDTDVSLSAFSAVVHPLRGPERTHAWAWVAAIPSAEREIFERRLHREYQRPIHVWEMDANGRAIPAGGRDMFFPLMFVTPMSKHADAIGFDLGSEPRRMAAILEAMHSQLPVATEPIRLVSETDEESSLMILQPVFDPDPPTTVRGFAVVALSMSALARNLSPYAPLQCRIYQLNEGQSPTLLTKAGEYAGWATDHTMLSRYANAYGRLYKFTVRPGDAFFRAHRVHASGLAAGTGVMSTLALALLIGKPAHRRRELERLVEARTRALREKQEEQEVLLRSEETARRVLAGVVENQKQARRELLVRDQLLSAAADAAQILLSASDITDAVNRALAAIGQATGQDRAYVFVRESDPQTGEAIVGQRFEWTREGVPSQLDNPELRSLLLRRVCPRWAELFDQGRSVHGAVSDFPAAEREILEPQGVISLLVVPVFVGGNFWGFVGLDNCHEVRVWNDGEQAVLNAVASAIGTAHARHEAVRALRVSEARFHALIQRMDHIPVQGYDESRRVIFWNSASEEVYGYSRREALGRRLEDLIIPESMRGEVIRAHEAWLEKGHAIPAGECILRDKQGRDVPVYSSHLLHVTEAGLREMFCVDIDLRRLRAAEEHVRQTHKMESIGRLAGGIAHDFNNILMVQLGYCDLLETTLGPTHEAAMELGEIRACAERAVALTKQLLAFSRKQTLAPRILDLDEVIHRVEKMLVRLIGETISLSVTGDEALWPVRADPGQLEQVVMNLAVNARDAMPSGGELHIEVRNVTLSAEDAEKYSKAHAGDHVRLRVADTGIGMDEETLQQLFEPFFTTKETGRGTGLGLSIVYGIVTQSDGAIRVESRMGAGTVFEIVFPRAAPEEETA